ncbi:MAG: DUF188 domain-containing protein [Planctomycetes bacterium]|nr:DUF188 domain-containing protein [Planctomycetota bacterium]
METAPETFAVRVDADACPYKREVLECSARFGLRVLFYSCQAQPAFVEEAGALAVRVEPGPDAVDQRLLEELQPGDVIFTSDLELAREVLARGGHCIGRHGDPFTLENIGEALARRELYRRVRLDPSVNSSRKGKKARKGPSERSRFKGGFHNLLCRLA